jgi:acyl carrier protein
VYIAPAEVDGSPVKIRDWLIDNEIHVATQMTSVAKHLWKLEWSERTKLRFLQIPGERIGEWPPAHLPFESVNVYGSTEAGGIAMCMMGEFRRRLIERGQELSEPPAGYLYDNVRAYILDRNKEPAPQGVVGEVYVAGPGLSSGYLDPNDTKSEFLRGVLPEEGENVVLRTGDLGRLWPKGVLEVLGRVDHQVKIRGNSVDIHAIETFISAIPGVQECTVHVASDSQGHNRVVAYVVPDGASRAISDTIRRVCGETLPSFAVPSSIVTLSAIPRLSNGKVDRNSLPKPVHGRMDRALAATSPRGEIETAIAMKWRALLRTENVGVFDDFFESGGHSLLAIDLLSDVRQRFGIDIKLSEFTKFPTISFTARAVERGLISGAGKGAVLSAEPEIPYRSVTEDAFKPFPLTDMQQALLVGRGKDLELGGIGSHGYFEWELHDIEAQRFESAWQTLVARHPMLRATMDDDATQRVLPSVPKYQIQIHDVRLCTKAQADKELARIREQLSHQIFDPHVWPLFEVRALLTSSHKTIYILSIDLLIVDAWSIFHVIIPELCVLLKTARSPLPPIQASFRDYVLSIEHASDAFRGFARSKDYWLKRIKTLPLAPYLPRNVAAKPASSARFVSHRHVLHAEEWEKLQQTGRAVGVTPSGLLIGAFAEVLRQWSNCDAFTLNIPIFDRMQIHPDINAVVGDFTGVILLEIDGNQPTLADRFKQVQVQVWRDLEHRHYSGIRLLREIMRVTHLPSRAVMPIVVTSLLGQPMTEQKTILGQPGYVISQTPQVSLDFQIREIDSNLSFNWDALEHYYPTNMIRDMFDAYCNLLVRLCNDKTVLHLERVDFSYPVNKKLVWDGEPTYLLDRHNTDCPDWVQGELFRVKTSTDSCAVVHRHRITGEALENSGVKAYRLPGDRICLISKDHKNGEAIEQDRQRETLGGSDRGDPEPQTALESVIAAIYCSLLGVSKVPVNENFVFLGGDSINAMRACGRIAELFETRISVAQILREGTVRKVASTVESQSADPDKIAKIAKRLLELSVADIDNMLGSFRTAQSLSNS